MQDCAFSLDPQGLLTLAYRNEVAQWVFKWCAFLLILQQCVSWVKPEKFRKVWHSGVSPSVGSSCTRRKLLNATLSDPLLAIDSQIDFIHFTTVNFMSEEFCKVWHSGVLPGVTVPRTPREDSGHLTRETYNFKLKRGRETVTPGETPLTLSDTCHRLTHGHVLTHSPTYARLMHMNPSRWRVQLRLHSFPYWCWVCYLSQLRFFVVIFCCHTTPWRLF